MAGVVNFVLDKNFTGLSVKADFGMSDYGDGEQWQFGAAWGTDLFDGRGHFEAVGHATASRTMIPISDRPYGEGRAGLAADRHRHADQSVRQHALCAALQQRAVRQRQLRHAPAPVNNNTFNEAGELSPLVHGTPTGTANVESGGDGGYVKYGTFRSEIEMKDVFARFSYDLTDDINFYVQGSWAQAGNTSNWINWVVSPSASRPNTLFANNPFLDPVTQQQLGASVVCGTPAATGWRCLPASPATSPQTGSTPPPPPTTPFFSAPSYIWNNVGWRGGRASTDRLYLTIAGPAV